MSDSRRPSASKPLRMIVIDDDPEWCKTLGMSAQALGHLMDSANSLEEAILELQKAEQGRSAYSVAIIDMNFEFGKKKIEMPRGKEVIKHIKTHHPYIACIMVSGSGVTPEEVLDLRDKYDLDDYIQKDRFDLDAFSKAIDKAVYRAASRHGVPLQTGVQSNADPLSLGPTSIQGSATALQPGRQPKNDRISWREILTKYFDPEEIKTLCFDLSIDYDSLPGEGKEAKVRELVSYCERHNRMPDLVEWIKQSRPDIQ